MLDAALPANLQQSLNTLLHADDKIHLINVLKHEASDFSNKELRQEVSRRKQLAPLHDFAQKFLMDATLSSESIKYYAGLVQFYTIYKLRRMDISTVRLYPRCTNRRWRLAIWTPSHSSRACRQWLGNT